MKLRVLFLPFALLILLQGILGVQVSLNPEITEELQSAGLLPELPFYTGQDNSHRHSKITKNIFYVGFQNTQIQVSEFISTLGYVTAEVTEFHSPFTHYSRGPPV